jgi:uncharacterized Rmd1/YagE family protein
MADVGPAISIGTRRTLPTCAVALDGRVVLRSTIARLPWNVVRQSSHSIVCQLPDGALLHVFAVGAVVAERADLVGEDLAIVEDATGRREIASTRESYAVRIEPDRSDAPVVDWDQVVLTGADETVLHAVALLLAQSVALERYERGIEAILDESLALARDLGQRGRPPWRRGLPIRRVANLTAERLELARWFFLLDRPEATWESAYAARVYDLLFQHFELRDRHEALMHKLTSVQSTLEIIIDLWQSRRSRLLEWAIIGLFVLEIVLAVSGWH